MSHLCEQLVDAARYLESASLSERQLSMLHHFYLKGRPITYERVYRYFSVNKDLRENNTDFAYRLLFVAREHRSNGQAMNTLVERALTKYPL